ncbi:MAG: LPS export ABC transporter permease LptF [Methylophilaceae bacterium]
MKIFKKSLSHELVYTATASFLILIGIIVAQRAGFLVGSAAKGWIPNDAVMTMLGFSLVRYLPIIMSLATFLAVLMTLSRWYRDSEMVIWFTAGLGITKWIRPIMGFALPIVIVIALLSFFVTPWAAQKTEDYRVEIESRDQSASLSPGVFNEADTKGVDEPERVYFVESFNELGNVFKNVFIQSIQHQRTGIMVASKGSRFTDKNGDLFIVLENGRRYQGELNTAEISTTKFERHAIRLETKEVAVKPEKVGTIPSAELFASTNPKEQAELQSRLAIPISAIILALLAVPLSFVDPRAGRSLNLMLAILIFIIYSNILNIFEAWVTQSKIPAFVGLWPVHFAFALLTVYLFHRRNQLLPIIPTGFKLIPNFATLIKKAAN